MLRRRKCVVYYETTHEDANDLSDLTNMIEIAQLFQKTGLYNVTGVSVRQDTNYDD